ncbi:GtrA family protein [Microbacterium barkeri]|uniref:GtrA family protein n=1 Tax=Microbacterium barkeri TaxID=33917 RepID=UPI0024AEDE66|nr:GtrA family protein [Microbacterium barkeri]MDI6943137.1 GtrA family protein [Microbacterium barkeri]
MSNEESPAETEAIAGMSGPDGPLLRLIRDRRVAFILVGGINTAVGFLWFTLFSALFRAALPDAGWPDAGWPVFAIIACAQVTSMLSAFVFLRTLVFRVRGHLWRDFWRFVLVNAVNAMLNFVVVPALIAWLNWHEILAQLLFTVIVAIISWFAHSRFSFHRDPEETAP